MEGIPMYCGKNWNIILSNWLKTNMETIIIIWILNIPNPIWENVQARYQVTTEV